MKTVRERPRVALAIVAGLALLVVVLLMLAGGETKTDPTAQRRADRAEAQVAAQKARVRQLTGDLRRGSGAGGPGDAPRRGGPPAIRPAAPGPHPGAQAALSRTL